MRRYIPLAVLAAVTIVLAAVFGPGLYRGALFRRDCHALLQAAQEGRTADVLSGVIATQRQRIARLVQEHVPADYYTRIHTLKLSSFEREDSQTIWSLVICRIEDGGVYQGKLRWIYQSGRWWWDVEQSYGAELTLSGEPAWQKFGTIIPLAEQL